MQKYEIMSFLYSRKHRNCAHRNGGQVNINDFHRQRKDKQQKSRQFVRFGVQKYLFILTHIAGNDVDDFYYGYHSNPNQIQILNSIAGRISTEQIATNTKSAMLSNLAPNSDAVFVLLAMIPSAMSVRPQKM